MNDLKETTLRTAFTSVPAAQGEAVAWEYFCDRSYFDMWCVLQKGTPKEFGCGYHVTSEDEAKDLAARLSAHPALVPGAVTRELVGRVATSEIGSVAHYRAVCDLRDLLAAQVTHVTGSDPVEMSSEAKGRDIYEVANQLEGYVDEGTPEHLARFLLREGKAAADLADEIVRLKAALAASHMPVVDGPVPSSECPFHLGQAVHLAEPYAEQDPSTVHYVTGIEWEYRAVAHRGWDITIATAEEIERGYGATTGFAPGDLLTAARAGEDGR